MHKYSELPIPQAELDVAWRHFERFLTGSHRLAPRIQSVQEYKDKYGVLDEAVAESIGEKLNQLAAIQRIVSAEAEKLARILLENQRNTSKRAKLAKETPDPSPVVSSLDLQTSAYYL